MLKIDLENTSIDNLRTLLNGELSEQDRIDLQKEIEKRNEFAKSLLNNVYFRTAVTLQLKGLKIVKNELVKSNKKFNGIDYVRALKDMVKIRNRKTKVETEMKLAKKRWA